jgi:NAD(P)H-nitrite reductase large subunit
MTSTRCSDPASIAPHEIVCSCLRVTAGELAEAMACEDIRSLKDVRRHTGAGGGCMVCHRLLRKYIEQQATVSC